MWSWQQLLDWVTAENPRRERDELLQAFEGLHGYPITMGNTLQVRAKVRTFINAKIAESGADAPASWDPHLGRRTPNGENGGHQNGQEEGTPPVLPTPETPRVPAVVPPVPPPVLVKSRKDYDEDPVVAERQIQGDVTHGVISGDTGRDLLREVHAEIIQAQEPSDNEEILPAGLQTPIIGVFRRVMRMELPIDRALEEMRRVAKIAAVAATEAILLELLAKYTKGGRVKLHEMQSDEVEVRQLAAAYPADEQPEAPPYEEAPPPSEEDDMAIRQPTGPDAGHEPQDDHVALPWKERSDYAAVPLTKVARTQVENDARRGLISEENKADLLSQIDAEEAAIQDQHDAQIGRLREIQSLASASSKPPSGGKGGGSNGKSRPFGGGRDPRDREPVYVEDDDDDRVVLERRGNRMVDRRATDDDRNPMLIPAILLGVLAAIAVVILLVWLFNNWDDITDDDDDSTPVSTQTPGNPGGQPTTTPQTPAATATQTTGNPGGNGGGLPTGQAPAAWTAPQPGSDLNNEAQFTKVPIDVAKEGQWNHRVFNMRLFNAANNWGGADSWFVSLVTGANSGGAWTSHGNPGQVVYRANKTHVNWCLGILTTAQYKDQFMAGATGSAAINVRITPNSIVTVKTVSGKVVNQATSDGGDITIVLPDSGVVTVCVDYTTATGTHESLVWWGPYDRSEGINTVRGDQ